MLCSAEEYCTLEDSNKSSIAYKVIIAVSRFDAENDNGKISWLARVCSDQTALLAFHSWSKRRSGRRNSAEIFRRDVLITKVTTAEGDTACTDVPLFYRCIEYNLWFYPFVIVSLRHYVPRLHETFPHAAWFSLVCRIVLIGTYIQFIILWLCSLYPNYNTLRWHWTPIPLPLSEIKELNYSCKIFFSIIKTRQMVRNLSNK